MTVYIRRRISRPEKRRSYYRARISLSKDEMGRLRGAKLLPGTPAEAFIRTDDRSVLSYFVKPIQGQIERAFRERYRAIHLFRISVLHLRDIPRRRDT
jgi:hypothetical protein